MKKVEFEIISQTNPIQIQVGNVSGIVGAEIESFYHTPSVPGNFPEMIGIVIDGVRGRYNQYGNQTEVIKTIPKINNQYNFSVQEPDVIRFTNPGNTFNIAFIDRSANSSINHAPLSFVNNYLLVVNLYTV